jgi:hypothetical protein
MTTTTNTVRNRRTNVQRAALIVGIVFLVVGVAGFIPGLTAGMGDMHMAGSGSDSKLLGLFQISVLHNIVHLLFGVAGLVFSRTARQARNYLIWGGVTYFVLFIYGLFFNGNSAANFVPFNVADNWLHLVLAVGMVALGVILGRSVSTRPGARA